MSSFTLIVEKDRIGIVKLNNNERCSFRKHLSAIWLYVDV